MICSQIEVGCFSQFFQLSCTTHGHLVSPSFCVQLWSELEPKDILLKPATNSTWRPYPLFPGDKSVMEVALQHYNPTQSSMIDRCHVFLQVISICDLLIFKMDNIHPAYLEGQLPLSRKSIITWPLIPCPPTRYWKIRNKFLSTHIVPLPQLSIDSIPWDQVSSWRFTPIFYKHHHSLGLYAYDGNLTLFKLRPKAKSSRKAVCINVPYQCSLTFNNDDFSPVETCTNPSGISIVGCWFHPTNNTAVQPPKTLMGMFNDLHPSLKQICGDIEIPPDDGAFLFSTGVANNNCLFGASDASLKDNLATHAWILSSGAVTDIEDPMMNISGAGPVHSLPYFLSSSRGELQGLAALSIIARLFMEFHADKFKISSTGIINFLGATIF